MWMERQELHLLPGRSLNGQEVQLLPSWPSTKRTNGCREHVYSNSVLSRRQVQSVSYIVWHQSQERRCCRIVSGAGPGLLWAEPCLEKFEKEVKGLDTMPKEGDFVSSDFLEKQPDVWRTSWCFSKKSELTKSPSLGSSGNVELFHRARGHHLQQLRGKVEKQRPLPGSNVAKYAESMCAGRKMANLRQTWCQWGRHRHHRRPPRVPDHYDRPWCQQTQRSCHTWWVPRGGFWHSGKFQAEALQVRQQGSKGRAHPWQTHFMLLWGSPVPRYGWLQKEEIEWVRTLQRLRRLHLLEWGNPSSKDRRRYSRSLPEGSWPQLLTPGLSFGKNRFAMDLEWTLRGEQTSAHIMAFPVLQFVSIHRDRSSMSDDFMDIFDMSAYVSPTSSCFSIRSVLFRMVRGDPGSRGRFQRRHGTSRPCPIGKNTDKWPSQISISQSCRWCSCGTSPSDRSRRQQVMALGLHQRPRVTSCHLRVQ